MLEKEATDTIDDESWHAIYIECHGDNRYTVRCVPHGCIRECNDWFDAVIAQYQHDYDFRGHEAMHSKTD